MTDFAGDVPDQYDPHAVEERVFEYWDRVDAYEKTKAHREDGEDFFFVDGPPYTSGAAHMGTTWNKTLKDAYIRFHRMLGYNVTDRPGYDMHGLPIETKVEENLGFENKKDIEEYGEKNFIEECKAFADEQLDGLQTDFQDFGVWMDWEDPYKTVDPQYMEAAWWGFQRAHERGLVERGKRSINQCPRCETAIANNEVEYEDVSDPSIYVKFPLQEKEGYLVIWTTTPWTIPGNTFVAVDGEATYAAVEASTADGESEVLYVEESLVEDVLKEGRYEDYEVLETVEGEEMVGWEYDHPLAEEVPDHVDFEGATEVYTAEYVEADRTGLVHSAPGHGEVDFERGQELGMEVFSPVAADGEFTEAAGKYAGEYVRDANDTIIEDLDAKGLLLASGSVHHSYGHCWRCGTPVIQLATDQWFITITDIKDELLENIEDSDWYPQWARDNRFRDFVEDAPDWNVSRQRYWGIPIPIWTPSADSSANEGGETAGGWSGDMDDAIVIGTREELAELVDQDVDPASVDLHKPTVDDLTITRDGTTYTRAEDVFDVWLDSSVASWGTVGFPEEEEAFEELWPADLIMEAHDQTRGWFWSQLGMATAALGEVPYEQVLMHGYANMPDGRGMSKSKGVLIDPHEVIEKHGRDPMRLFLLSVTPQGEDMRFSWEGTETMQRDLNILWNAFRFPLPYMEMDGVEATDLAVEDGVATWTRDGDVREARLERADRWLLSRLQAVVHDAAEAWEHFEQHRALEALLEFVVEDVSRYYIQVVRERMWDEETTDSKLAAYATLVHTLEEVIVLLAPYAPFVTEEIYQRLTGDAGFPTVHMADFPTPTETLRDTALEADVEVLREIEEAGSHARQLVGRKLRWPVTRVVVDAEEDRVVTALERHGDLLAERLNARRVELIDPQGQWGELQYTATADMGVLGPEFGDDAPEVMEAINETVVDEPTVATFEEGVRETLGEDVDVTRDMIEFEEVTPEDVAGSDFEGGTVYVDATLSDVVESEGYAREIIRRVQEMRKDLDLDLDAEIVLEITVFDERVGELIADRQDLIETEVRAAEVRDLEEGHREQFEIEGVDVELAIEPVA